jgi:hypothetical protein
LAGEFESLAGTGLERYLDVAIGVADGVVVGEGEVHAAGGQADIVEDRVDAIRRNDLSNLLLDRRENSFRSFDARSLRRKHVQSHLA